MSGELLLPDTNVWIAYFERRNRVLWEEFDRRYRDGQVAVILPVRYEVLRGERRAARFDLLRGFFDGLEQVTLTRADWDHAASLYRGLIDSRGKHRVQTTDLLLAAVALRTGRAIWSADPDFPDRIAAREPMLRLFEP